MRRVVPRALVAILVVVPLASRLIGDGSLAWTMYASTSEWRLRVTVTERDGRSHAIAPTGLAEGASPELQAALAGSESYRRNCPVALRSHLSQVADRACATRDVARVEIDLDERGSFGERTMHVERACGR